MENKINIKLVIHRLSTVILFVLFFLLPQYLGAYTFATVDNPIYVPLNLKTGSTYCINKDDVGYDSGTPQPESFIGFSTTTQPYYIETSLPMNNFVPLLETVWSINCEGVGVDLLSEALYDSLTYYGYPAYPAIDRDYIILTQFNSVWYISNYTVSGVGTSLEASTTPNPYATRVDTTYPANEQIIATSSSPTIFTFDGYINTNDWNSSSQYSWIVSKSRKCANPLSGCTEYLPQDELFRVRKSINTSGDIDESYIQQITELGEYFMFIDYTKGTYCVLGFCLGDEIVYSTSTTFTVSTTTNRDLLRKKAEKDIQDMGAEGDENTFNKCKIADFDLLGCSFTIVDYLFIPNNGENLIKELKEGALSHPPIGYITRFVNIVNATTTTALPSVSYTFSTSTNSALQPILGGEKITLSPFDYMYASGTPLLDIKSDGANGLPQKDVWDIFSPLVNIIVYGTLLFIVVNDLTKIHPNIDRNLN